MHRNEKTALLIIDMQNDVMNMVPTGRSVAPAIRRVLDFCREKQIPVIHKLRVHRPDGVDVERFRLELFKREPFLVEGSTGAEIVAELRPIAGEYQVRGARFSGFFQTDLLLILHRLGVETLVVCGVQTPNCVRSTVVDGIGYDFHTVVLSDATAAKTSEIHAANLLDMQNMGVSILTCQEWRENLT